MFLFVQDVFESKMDISIEKNKTYFLCSCEKSAKYPFCDGSHRGTGKKSIPYTSNEDKTLVFEKGRIVDV